MSVGGRDGGRGCVVGQSNELSQDGREVVVCAAMRLSQTTVVLSLDVSRSFGGFSDIGALKGRCPLEDDEDGGEFTTDAVSDCRQRRTEVLLSRPRVPPPPCRSIPHSISLMTAKKHDSESAKRC